MPVDRPPICPSCGATMRTGRRIPAFMNQPELQNFECRPCGIVVTEAVPRPTPADANALLPLGA